MINGIDTLGTVSITIAFIGIALWILWAVKNKEKAFYAVPPLTWLLNVLVLYTIYTISGDSELFDLWQKVVRLHAIFLVTIGVGVGLIGYSREKALKNKIIEEKFY